MVEAIAIMLGFGFGGVATNDTCWHFSEWGKGR